MTPEAIERLVQYSWPGNVRELENVLQRALVTCRGGIIHPHDLELRITDNEPSKAPRSFKDEMHQYEGHLLTESHQQHGGNVAAMARALELPISTAYRLLQKHNLQSFPMVLFSSFFPLFCDVV